MTFELITITQSQLARQNMVSRILKLNDLTSQFHITLTPTQVEDLIETRFVALRDRGLLEFGEGILAELIDVFCDSPYLNMDNYAESLNTLTEIFYYIKNESRGWFVFEEVDEDEKKVTRTLKNETRSMISDKEIIAEMKNAFDTVCEGSLELLAGREADEIAKSFLMEYKPEYRPISPEDFGSEWGGDN